MPVDWRVAFDVAFSIAAMLGGWMLRVIYTAIQDLKTEDGKLADRINQLPGVYMRRDDFMAFASDIKATLLRIETKIDNKADKSVNGK